MTRRAATYRTIADTNENIVSAFAGWLIAIYPDLTTTGTITLRNQKTASGGTPVFTSVCAIGLTQAGKNFGPSGIFCSAGLTIQLSAGTDLCFVLFERAKSV